MSSDDLDDDLRTALARFYRVGHGNQLIRLRGGQRFPGFRLDLLDERVQLLTACIATGGLCRQKLRNKAGGGSRREIETVH